MQPMFGRRTTSLPGAQPSHRRAEQRGQAQGRMRRLALEVCEPRWLLAALPWSVPLLDASLADPSPAAEVFTPGRTALADPASGSIKAPTAARDRSGNVPGADPAEIDGDDGSETSDWNSLGAGPETMTLSATLEGSTIASPEEETWSDPPDSLRSEQNQPDEPAGPEATNPGSLDGLSAMRAPAASGSGLEAERREWTPAGIVRYPLYDAPRTTLGGQAVCLAPARARSLVFLDVGRAATPVARSPRPGSADGTPMELAQSNGRFENLETEFATDLARPSRAAQNPSAAAPSRFQPSLAGENRGQRMMLLAAAGRRLRDRVDASPPPLYHRPPELPHVPMQNDNQASKGDDETLKTSPAATTLPDRLGAATCPVADDHTRRSAVEGTTVLMLLAADWFAKTHVQSRLERQEPPSPGLLDSWQVAARDKFFERLFAP